MIQIHNLTKQYSGFASPLERILTALSFGIYKGSVQFTALKDISLEINKGEIAGIIGRNGAGKSTLLKVLSGVSGYNSGLIEIDGEIRSILELGVGFNPELSGYENVYFNGLVWGFAPKEMKAIISDVFEYAGLNEFLHVPLKNYSTGMIMRLGFSLATARRPDVLLVDEALSVGDASFQQKCISRFREFKKSGTSILVVSHDLELLQSLCDKIFVLDKGKLQFCGRGEEAVSFYIQLLAKKSFGEDTAVSSENEYIDSYSVSFGSNKTKRSIFMIGEEGTLSIKVKLKKQIPFLTVGFHIIDKNGVTVFGTNSYQLNREMNDLLPDQVVSMQYQFPLNIAAGKYSIGISLHEGDNHTKNCYLWKDGVLDFEIERAGAPKFSGSAYLPVTCDYRID